LFLVRQQNLWVDLAPKRWQRLDFFRHGSGVQWVEERKAALAV
jgi:hypothetical protein